MGNQLIKSAALEIKREFPHIKLATLSPIPGFANWMKNFQKIDLMKKAKGDMETKRKDLRNENEKETESNNSLEELKNSIINANNALKYQIIHQCRHYLLKEKRRGLALDPVANFHFKNGATFRNVIWMGNTR